jgi:hypothetical protein
MVMRRELDGQGAAYSHQFDAALGRFSRINANLSWEHETLSDVTNWTASSSGGNFTQSVVGQPRRVQVGHDGSASSDAYGGVESSVLVSEKSLGDFRVTFKDVSFTDNADRNSFALGVSDLDSSADILNSGNGIFYYNDVSGNDKLLNVSGGNSTSTFFNPQTDWTVPDKKYDVSLEYTGSELQLFIDGGSNIGAQSFSTPNSAGPFTPRITLLDNGGVSQSEQIEIGQIVVEPIGGTF